MLTEKELREEGYHMGIGLRYGADVDVWYRHEDSGDISVILRDCTTGATSAPFSARNTRGQN